MKGILALLFIVALAAGVFSQEVLPAMMGNPDQKTFELSNCRSPEGGPTTTDVSVTIDNPMPVQLKVSYQFLDMATGSYTDQQTNTYCYVPPSGTRTCTFSIPVRVGGTGNGTFSNVELLRLKGEDSEGKISRTYVASFTFTINHLESREEVNALGKISGAMALLSQVVTSIPCSGSVCCGMGGASDNVEKAKSSIEGVKEYLKMCNVSAAYFAGSFAYESAKKAAASTSSNTESCTGALAKYNGAKQAVDSAASYVSSLGCTPDSGTKAALGAAQDSLKNGAVLISTDEYDNANLEFDGAKKSASAAKAGKCAEAASGGTGNSGTGTGSGTGKPTTGGADPAGDTAKGEPLCPLGIAVFSLVALGAFANSKR